ncbi:1-(5-phosphoribosyl)-5-[(5-phosphoribosylamino)methylideneamino]imidazole-4-carboxamide isomerase [Anoxybacillus flavithermus]|uniref:1-(5-phosphoribosyl)-5-[(5-phosphoribosylamino)methylideneamino] imidazole-4-carboxamide isomerase n=1 Tax=Anoxybacillus flavithermus TaxID=33934 RepID=A0A2G5RSP5_9BACL|nr:MULTISPECIES: 1-(5-phosphoribosyl)-5-[(5-phosphoribosylamino)methylideneamino]imidazole-4-carboxamide isomerase [Anoxybacillus]KFZ42518.1 1-(5-phosphoribosyl)-5-[(5-phosphoribosylamino)methylideneamino] imidazole-4-carboxamide isomerase [Anoxybacillus sp. KU2-6(11)]PIC05785.1 1-(5-phosphoribosyl)-5-[(5-phosphoribosylamino)methylideneamino]imidazole-4-carboxamide isomerase [Anoxybacillus flavithermus]
MFTIYPAIDMRGGKCVRLIQGDYSQETVYGHSPVEMARSFVSQGATWIHMVDLDGAKEGRRVNDTFVVEVANMLGVSVQIGGGIRTEEDVAYYLEQGVSRVILGSAAISNPSFVKAMLRTYGERIVIGIDAKNGFVATEGWTHTSTIEAVELGKQLADAGAETFIFTDIATDGMLSGPNIDAVVRLAKETNKRVIASGGIRSLDDLCSLKQFENDGVCGAIVGKALYTNQFTVAEALKAVEQ